MESEKTNKAADDKAKQNEPARGKMPYQYKITFDPPIIESIANQTLDGVIKAKIKKPELGIDKDTEITYQIDVTDAENKTAVLTKDKVKKFVIKIQ